MKSLLDRLTSYFSERPMRYYWICVITSLVLFPFCLGVPGALFLKYCEDEALRTLTGMLTKGEVAIKLIEVYSLEEIPAIISLLGLAFFATLLILCGLKLRDKLVIEVTYRGRKIVLSPEKCVIVLSLVALACILIAGILLSTLLNPQGVVLRRYIDAIGQVCNTGSIPVNYSVCFIQLLYADLRNKTEVEEKHVIVGLSVSRVLVAKNVDLRRICVLLREFKRLTPMCTLDCNCYLRRILERE